jgi:hypothetical protein
LPVHRLPGYRYARLVVLRRLPERRQYVSAIDVNLIVKFNRDMLRCESCDGILTKEEKHCYQCGDPVPEQAKADGIFTYLFAMALILTLGFTAYSFL